MPRPSRPPAVLRLVAVTASACVALGAALQPAAAAPTAVPTGWEVVERAVVPSTNDVTVVMLVPRGSEPSFPRHEAVDAVGAVAAYYDRETDGALQVRSERVVDWMRVDTDLHCEWTGGLLDWAEPRIGWSRAPGRHLVAMVPTNGTCPDWANGEQNGWVGAGGRAFQPGSDPNFLVHELGHNMSLPHASSTSCGAAWDFSTLGAGLPAGCTREEYGNLLDMMGGSWRLDDALSSPGLDRLGMLPRRYEPVCGGERRLELGSLALGAQRRTSVSWQDPRDPGVRYWVDLRSGGSTPRPGLQVLRTDAQDPLGTTVLERPGDRSDRRQLLAVGERVGLGGGAWVRLQSLADDGRTGQLAVSVPCRAGATLRESATTATLAQARVGHGATVAVTVRVTGPGGTPSGLVTVTSDGAEIGRGRLASDGTLVLQVPTRALVTGRQVLGVAYDGDDRFGSSVAAVPLTVARAATRTSTRVSAPDGRGRGAVATVRVTRDPAGSLPSRVRLVLQRGERTVAERVVGLRGGAARWALPRLRDGRHRLVAVVRGTATATGSRDVARVPARR